MKFKIHPKIILCFLILLNAIFITLSTGVYIARFSLNYDSPLLTAFALGKEMNLPTFYQSISIFFCSLLLTFIAFATKNKGETQYFLYWFVLAVIFFYLSLDEMLQIHERLIVPLRMLLNARGILYFTWVVPFAVALAILFAIYIRFLLKLPKRSWMLFILSGAFYVAGGMGIEMLGGRYCSIHGSDNFVYVMYQTAEESFEMFGITIFIYALLEHIRSEFKYILAEIE